MAFAIVLLLTVALSIGVRETSAFIDIMTIIKFVFMVMICIAGFTQANGSIFADNFTLPKTEVSGIFQAGALLFFSFVAFDAVTVAVEEVRVLTLPSNSLECQQGNVDSEEFGANVPAVVAATQDCLGIPPASVDCAGILYLGSCNDEARLYCRLDVSKTFLQRF